MTTEFSQLFEYVKKIRSRYLLVLSATNVFDCLDHSLTQNKVGKKKALKNEKTMRAFGYFFMTTKEACRCYLLIELAKFFDKHKSNKTLNVYNVLEYSKKNINKLTTEHFKQYHKDREILDVLFQKYKPLSLADVKKIEKKIEGRKDIIKKFKDYRDQYLAHDDLDKIKVDINTKDVRLILSLLKSFIRLYYLRLDFASNSYKNFTEVPYEETKLLIEYLQKYEKYRIKEIEERYNTKLPNEK